MAKRNNLNKVLFALTSILLFCNVFAENLDLISDKYILYNLNDNKILMQKNENEETQIASLTKIMTIIVAIENITDFDEKVTITKDMVNNIEWDVAKIGLKSGDIVTYNDLLYGAMLPSAADCVNALAISISGNYKDFIELMNNKVKELKLEHTHFENVVGLYSKDNYSSAYDVAEILKYSLKNKKFKQIFEAKEYVLTNGKKINSTLKIYNKKVGEDISYITGAKTGYIKLAGNCLASTATIDNVNYLLVTLNAYSNKKSPHILDATSTYKYFSNNYSYKYILTKNDVVVNLKTKYAKEKNIDIHSSQEYKYYLKNDFNKESIKYEYDGIKEISYFTKKGTTLGKVKIKLNDEILETFELIYNENLTFSIASFLWINKAYVIAIILFIIILLKISKRKKEKKRVKVG
ncbi:MAG: D-alanyl-D-alanine carboxypeptidase family protein [Bacilli bacterium]